MAVTDAEAPRVPRQGAAALALRLAGASYIEVADMLGLPSAVEARDQVEVALAARAWQAKDQRDSLRAEDGARIERLLRSVWPKATNPDHHEHLVAVKVALSLIDRHSRLYGLDAPTEFVVHNPTQAELDQWVSAMVAHSADDLRAMEANVAGELIEATASE